MAKYIYTGPEQFRPLSPWAYFGYTILFGLPLIGFIFLIIYSFDDSRINRRNFARSYFCVLLIVIILIALLFATGVLAKLLSAIPQAV